MTNPLLCPHGHKGPFWYVEAILIHRNVYEEPTAQQIHVAGRWETSEGFNEGLDDSEFLMCRARNQLGMCAVKFPVPSGAKVVWEE